MTDLGKSSENAYSPSPRGEGIIKLPSLGMEY